MKKGLTLVAVCDMHSIMKSGVFFISKKHWKCLYEAIIILF